MKGKVPAASHPPSSTAVPAVSKIVVTDTTTNHAATSVKTIPTPGLLPRPSFTFMHASSGGAPPLSSPGLTAVHPMPSPGGSPSLAKRLPLRINSPAFTPKSSHMNPNAVDFVPGRGMVHDAHGLVALPTSTADMERGESLPKPSVAKVAAWRPRSVVNSPIAGPVRLDQKSEKEIFAISQQSALKVDAQAYQPNKRTLTRVTLAKPSPLLLAADPDNDNKALDMLLDDLWSLFYLPSSFGESIKEEDYNPTLIFRIESIPTFWKVFNNIPQPSEMPISTLYLFRDGIAPKWEDPANRSGGIVKVKVTASQMDEAWELLLCRTIGDSWSASVRSKVNGVALKVRDRGTILEVWVTEQTPELMRDLTELWKTVFHGAFATTYISHDAMQTRAQAAAALLAEKNKKQRCR